MLLDMPRLAGAVDRRFPPRPGELPLLAADGARAGELREGAAAASLIIGHERRGRDLDARHARAAAERRRQYALLFGAWVAVTELIPYLGPWLGAIPPVLYALVVHPLSALWVALLFLGIQQLEGHVVVPKVMGSALRLHPLLVIFGLLAGGEIYGLPGVLVALPLLAAGRAIWEFFSERVVLEPWRRGGPPCRSGAVEGCAEPAPGPEPARPPAAARPPDGVAAPAAEPPAPGGVSVAGRSRRMASAPLRRATRRSSPPTSRSPRARRSRSSGPNGAGKSTLLALLAGALAPSGGTVERRDGVRVGWAPQRPAQYGRLSARENLELFARLEGDAEPAAAAARLLDEFDLPTEAQAERRTLSVGNRQRLNLAIALLGEPDVLLLDEPTAALDPAPAPAPLGALSTALRERGGAVVFATQNGWSEDRARAVLAEGRLALTGGSSAAAERRAPRPPAPARAASHSSRCLHRDMARRTAAVWLYDGAGGSVFVTSVTVSAPGHGRTDRSGWLSSARTAGPAALAGAARGRSLAYPLADRRCSSGSSPATRTRSRASRSSTRTTCRRRSVGGQTLPRPDDTIDKVSTKVEPRARALAGGGEARARDRQGRRHDHRPARVRRDAEDGWCKSPHARCWSTTKGGLAPRVEQQVQALVYQLNRQLQQAYIEHEPEVRRR